jgi:hypothetical protein
MLTEKLSFSAVINSNRSGVVARRRRRRWLTTIDSSATCTSFGHPFAQKLLTKTQLHSKCLDKLAGSDNDVVYRISIFPGESMTLSYMNIFPKGLAIPLV